MSPNAKGLLTALFTSAGFAKALVSIYARDAKESFMRAVGLDKKSKPQPPKPQPPKQP